MCIGSKHNNYMNVYKIFFEKYLQDQLICIPRTIQEDRVFGRMGGG
jgi:hypothetical protein